MKKVLVVHKHGDEQEFQTFVSERLAEYDVSFSSSYSDFLKLDKLSEIVLSSLFLPETKGVPRGGVANELIELFDSVKFVPNSMWGGFTNARDEKEYEYYKNEVYYNEDRWAGSLRSVLQSRHNPPLGLKVLGSCLQRHIPVMLHTEEYYSWKWKNGFNGVGYYQIVNAAMLILTGETIPFIGEGNGMSHYAFGQMPDWKDFVRGKQWWTSRPHDRLVKKWLLPENEKGKWFYEISRWKDHAKNVQKIYGIEPSWHENPWIPTREML